MSENERELIRIIRESEDPAKAMCFMITLIAKFLEGGSFNAGNVE